jgi:hypothetical protein
MPFLYWLITKSCDGPHKIVARVTSDTRATGLKNIFAAFENSGSNGVFENIREKHILLTV